MNPEILAAALTARTEDAFTAEHPTAGACWYELVRASDGLRIYCGQLSGRPERRRFSLGNVPGPGKSFCYVSASDVHIDSGRKDHRGDAITERAEAPAITLAATTSEEKAAQEIARRLLPRCEPIWAAMLKEAAERDERKASMVATREALTAAGCRFRPADNRSGEGDSFHGWGPKDTAASSWHLRVELGGSVTFERVTVTPDQAVRILAAVAGGSH